MEPYLKIQSSGEVLLTETDLLPKLQEMMFRQTVQSEGYGTVTQHSSDVISEVSFYHEPLIEFLFHLSDDK